MSGYPLLVVNEFTDSLTGHANVSVYDANGNLTGTFGANVRDMDGNMFNGYEGGIFDETGSRMPSFRTSFEISQAQYDSLMGVIRGQVSNTLAQVDSYYRLFGKNCVDAIEGWLKHINIDFDMPSLFQGALLDGYATAKNALTKSWDFFYNEMLGGNYNILDRVSDAFSKFWESVKSLFVSDASDEVHDNEVAAQGTIYSPIALDLDGDGLSTTSFSSSDVKFDLDGNGVAEKTAWLSPTDGFLAFDQNGDLQINDGSELFGGGERGEGYLKLAKLDTDKDGRISANDEAFNNLLIWRDANSDGVSEAWELHRLAELGVEEISVDYHSWNNYDNGNLIGEHSFALVNGAVVAVGDIYFTTDMAVAA